MSLRILCALMLLIATAILAWLFQDLFSLTAIKISANQILNYVQIQPVKGTLLFIVFYFMICALPTPLVSVPTMLAGYLFGHIHGILIVSFTSALGGTCLFLVSRYLLRDWLQQKLSHRLTQRFPILQQASKSNSFSHALALRLVPGMPFSIPAIALSISQLHIVKFYASTQIGLLVILFVYVNAGKNLAQVHSLNDIFSVPLISSLLLLALAPIGFKWVLKSRFLFTNIAK